MRKSLSILGVLLLAVVLTFHPADAGAALPEFSGLAAQAGPAVVNINTEKTAKSNGSEEYFGEMFRNLPPGFERFFEPFHRGPQGKGKKRNAPKQKSLGSGFLISADGYIVTNFHVVDGADVINVTLDEKAGGLENVKAVLVGSDQETDLALLKIDVKEKLPYLEFGDSDALKVGEWLLAIGNPFGLDHTVTAGILSAKGRRINAGAFDNFLQTDASINPGNSGGPLLNMEGKVVGINTAIIASGQGIGFAIPSTMARDIISQVRDGKKVTRGWLGIVIQDVDEQTAKALGLPDTRGALVASVQPDQPAEKAGLRDGDIIRSLDGKAVANRDELMREVASKKPGTETRVEVWRNGGTRTFTVKLGDRSTGMGDRDGSGAGVEKQKNEVTLGLSVRPLNADEKQQYELDNGLVIIDIDADKPAADANLRPGDVITKANMKPVKTVAELAKIVREEGVKRGALVLQVMRRGELFFTTVAMPAR